ncbi:PDR/VanB family oxidoreductase [Massilia sp. DD77]
MFEAKVVARVQEAQDIASLELAGMDGAPLPPFTAGAHIDIEAAPGLVRQYSLCNDPRERHRYRIAVLRDPASRGGSQAVHERIQPGATVRISAPRNHFALAPAPRYLLLAGGIGVTPILCMAQQLAHEGAEFRMHYCARSPERMAFAGRIRQSGFADRVSFHFDTAQALDIGAALLDAGADAHLYVCGPGGFIDAVTTAAMGQGWEEGRVHREYFTAPVHDSSGDRPFALRIASTGRLLAVPAGKTALAVLQENGIDIPVSCEQGICGTCATRVLDGVPEHRDDYLTDAERAANDQFTPCCSRARSGTLVLDL